MGISELKSHVENNDPRAILAMWSRGGMHVDEFANAAHDEKEASDIINHWDDVEHLIWNVVPILWSIDESWDDSTMRQRLVELQDEISLGALAEESGTADRDQIREGI